MDASTGNVRRTISDMESRTTFLNVDDTKAGMGDVDKEKINRLIQEASKSKRNRSKMTDVRTLVDLDSKFFKQQQRREEVSRTVSGLCSARALFRKIVGESK